MAFKPLQYCRLRGQYDKCIVETYNKERVCSNCRDRLQNIADDMAYIAELNIIGKTYNE